MTPRLFVGPMSKEIVENACEFSNSFQKIGLIPSRRQIEFDKGYVNDWDTNEFSNYARSISKNILLCRDHGGPMQGKGKDDGLTSFENDIENNFDILHIDPWKNVRSIDEAVEKTTKLIRHCNSINNKVEYEIGTEEAIFSYSYRELDWFLSRVERSLGDIFKNVRYAVIQSGVKISGDKNTGNYDKNRLREMIKVVKGYNILSKEHNGDYLSIDQIKSRADLGLDSINIAPEFGVTQTKLLIAHNLLDMQKAFDVCFASGKFIKWLPEDVSPKNAPKDLVVSLSGHYCFTNECFESGNRNIHHQERFKNVILKRFEDIVNCW